MLEPPIGPHQHQTIKVITISLNSRHFSLFEQNNIQKSPPNLIHFCELKPHAKFQNPRTKPSGKKKRDIKKETKTPLLVERTRTEHTLGPKFIQTVFPCQIEF